jgi:hypothetical protein
MPKPITIEMLEAMSTDQRKTLYRNAVALDTDAAKDVIELLSQNDLMAKPAAVGVAAKKKAKATPAKAAAKKSVTAKHGRQT